MVAFLLDMNRVAVLLGVYSNLPWFLAPLLRHLHDGRARADRQAAARLISGQQVGQPVRAVALPAGLLAPMVLILRPLFWPYMVGSLLGALVLRGHGVPAGAGVRAEPPRSSRHHS